MLNKRRLSEKIKWNNTRKIKQKEQKSLKKEERNKKIENLTRVKNDFLRESN